MMQYHLHPEDLTVAKVIDFGRTYTGMTERTKEKDMFGIKILYYMKNSTIGEIVLLPNSRRTI